MKVNPKEIVVSGITAVDRVYEEGRVTVEQDVSGIVFEGLVTGDELTVAATGTMQDDSIGEDKSVAITYGELGGSDAGNYVMAADGNQTTAVVNIFEYVVYPVTVTGDGHGTASADKTTAAAGETVTLTAVPDDGYQFKEWQAEGAVIKEDGTFVMPDHAVTVKAIFAADTPEEPWVYEIIEGADSVWTKGSADDLPFTSNAPFAKFDSVKVDGSVLAPENYYAEEGSTKVTLRRGYLETLSTGQHSIEIVSDDGSVSANFTVKTVSADTGDDTSVSMLMMLAAVSGIALAAAVNRRRSITKE